MEKKYSLIIEKHLHDDVVAYCKLNNIEDVEKFKLTCFVKGYNIDKYGLFGDERDVKVVQQEVVKEVIIEKPVEVIVEKIIHDETKLEELRQEFSTKTQEMEKIFQNEKQSLLDRIEELGEGKVVEVIKEVVVEKEKIGPTEKEKMLQETVTNMRNRADEKDKKIKELEDKVSYLSNIIQNKLAVYHPSSNLKDVL